MYNAFSKKFPRDYEYTVPVTTAASACRFPPYPQIYKWFDQRQLLLWDRTFHEWVYCQCRRLKGLLQEQAGWGGWVERREDIPWRPVFFYRPVLCVDMNLVALSPRHIAGAGLGPPDRVTIRGPDDGRLFRLLRGQNFFRVRPFPATQGPDLIII